MAGSRLDPWVGSYASRAHSMTASEIRSLFAVASRPEVVSLAGGMPYVQALPAEMLADTVAELIRDRGAVALQYGSGQGDVRLREQITAEYMPAVGISAHPDDVVVTTGSQMALDLVVRVFCDPGDVVLIPQPSYPLFEMLSRLDGVATAPYRLTHHDGWSLDRRSIELAVTPRTKAVLVVSPNNPTGSVITADDAAWLDTFAASRHLAVIADEVFLDYAIDPSKALPSIRGTRALTARLHLWTGSYGGGNRVGHLAGEPELVRHDDHRHAFRGEHPQRVEHFADELGIERRGHLVEQHDLRLECQRAGDGDTLLLSSREGLRPRVHLVAKSDAVEELFRAEDSLVAAQFQHLHRRLNEVAQYREVWKQIELLKNDAALLAAEAVAGACRERTEVVAEHLDRVAGLLRHDRRDEAKDRVAAALSRRRRGGLRHRCRGDAG